MPATLQGGRHAADDVSVAGFRYPPGGGAEIGRQRQACDEQKGKRKPADCIRLHSSPDFREREMMFCKAANALAETACVLTRLLRITLETVTVAQE